MYTCLSTTSLSEMNAFNVNTSQQSQITFGQVYPQIEGREEGK